MIFRAQKGLMEITNAGGNLPVYDGNPANLHSATQYAYFPSSTTSIMEKGMVGFINAIQPIFAGGRIYNGNRLASLGEEVSEFKNKMTADEVNLKTEEQYWQIVSLEEKQKTIDKYEELLNRLLVQVKEAFNSGLVMKNDVLKVKLKLNEVLLNKSKLENGRKLAAMAFCQYIGIPYDSTLTLSDNLTIKENPQNLFVENSEALMKRTEYSLLEKSVEAEKLRTKMKLGEYLPQVSIGVNGMYMKFDENKDRTLGMIFSTVSVPISSWWGGSHELEERSIKEEIAENDFKNNSELLVLQIEKAWQDLSDAYKQYLLSEESKVQAEENMKVNDDSYKNGLSNVSDLLEAQALLQQTQDQLTDAKANYVVKKTTYLQVTGR
jgi:outer membrane protein TolC